MKVLTLLRRAAGKPAGYLVKRGARELGRRLRLNASLRRWNSLTTAQVAQLAEFDSLAQLWRSGGDGGLGLDRGQRHAVSELLLSDYPHQADLLKQSCERILRHEFDLLGSGPTRLGPEIDWHIDFKSGKRWDDKAFALNIDYAELDRPSDVKVPWELSRCQHLVTLGRGWTVFRDERYVDEFQAQVRSWIQSNPLGFGVNWSCTMDVALRSVSWIWALGLFESAPLDPDFEEEILLALYRHGLWIPRNLEIGPVNGNHYLADLLGMIACGVLFSATPEGKRWLEEGARLLEEEAPNQIEDDGVNIEASVQYHRLVLEIFLVGRRFCAIGGKPLSRNFDKKLEGMLDFVDAYTTRAGRSPVVGDVDDGRALILGETDLLDHRYLLSTGSVLFQNEKWKRRAGICWPDTLWLIGPEAKQRFEALPATDEGGRESRHFEASGFHILRTRHQYLFVDAGPVGFRGLGGHGHNDCLSFEWHVRGRPILTDSGSFVYTSSPEWRNLFRSTAYHNTIRIDGEEINRFPSELALWNLRDDARPIGVSWESSPECERLQAGHTGYQRLNHPVSLSRTFGLSHTGHRLVVRDSLEGAGRHRIEAFFHAAPGALPVRLAECVAFQWEEPSGPVRLTILAASSRKWSWRQESGWFSPGYGVKVQRPVWIATVVADLPLQVEWMLQADFD